MKKLLIKAIMMTLCLFMIAACNGRKEEEKEPYDMNYLVLVNKLNPLPEDWEEKLQVTSYTNSIGDETETEVKAYEAYQKLKADLEKEGIHVDLDSARRTIAAQQKIVDDFTEKYGAEYTAKVVAKPGYSEHHTGLALDLYLNVNGVDYVENEDLVTFIDIWEVIHSKLPQYGFILRYLENKEHITGYAYEPWHIRYIDDPELAKEIMDKGITLESYLGAVKETDPILDYGQSELYNEGEINEAMITVKCQFAAMKGIELNRVAYAGDECNSEENLNWINSFDSGHTYTKIIELLTDFRTPKEGYGTLNPDFEYTDYQWWLALNEEGDWDIVSFGY